MISISHRLFELLTIFFISCIVFVLCTHQESVGTGLQQTSIQYTHGIPDGQYNALWDLFNATNGVEWHYLHISGGTEWDFSEPNANPCAGKHILV
jgi:hypothetical protein